jgi:hypothetical protein
LPPKREKIFETFCCLYFSHWKHKKLEFSQILVLVWFQKFSHILMKWINGIKAVIFTKGPNFLLSRPKFWAILGEILLKRVGNTVHLLSKAYTLTCFKIISGLQNRLQNHRRVPVCRNKQFETVYLKGFNN